jgi:hypothetical protein
LPRLNLSFERRTVSWLDNIARNNVTLDSINTPSPSRPIAPNEIKIDVPNESPSSKKIKAKWPLSKEVVMEETPSFDEDETEFKDHLLSFTTDMLFNDVGLIRNIVQRRSKAIYYIDQLRKLIANLYLTGEEKNKFDSLVDIDVEPVIIHTCVCKDFISPFIAKIKSIIIYKSVCFLLALFAINMSSPSFT